MLYIKGKGDNTHQYYEENKTKRYSTQFVFNHTVNENNFLQIKNSVSYFNRNTAIPNYEFDGTQTATFTEASYTHSKEKSEWVSGVNIGQIILKKSRLRHFR